MTYVLQLQTEEKLRKFTKLLQFFFCRRCYDLDPLHGELKGRHNNGQIYVELAKGPTIFNLFEGFISAFFAFEGVDYRKIIDNRTKKKSDNTAFEMKLAHHLCKRRATNESPFFRENIRPVLSELFLGKHDIWIRHGIEKIKRTGKIKFQKTERFPESAIVDYLAVETGTLYSFRNALHSCVMHHSRRFQPQGFIRFEKLKKRDIKLLPVHHKRDAGKNEDLNEGRDHLCMSANLPWNDWIFLYNYKMIEKQCSNPREVVSETRGLEHTLALDFLQIIEKIGQTIKLIS